MLAELLIGLVSATSSYETAQLRKGGKGKQEAETTEAARKKRERLPDRVLGLAEEIARFHGARPLPRKWTPDDEANFNPLFLAGPAEAAALPALGALPATMTLSVLAALPATLQLWAKLFRKRCSRSGILSSHAALAWLRTSARRVVDYVRERTGEPQWSRISRIVEALRDPRLFGRCPFTPSSFAASDDEFVLDADTLRDLCGEKRGRS